MGAEMYQVLVFIEDAWCVFLGCCVTSSFLVLIMDWFYQLCWVPYKWLWFVSMLVSTASLCLQSCSGWSISWSWCCCPQPMAQLQLSLVFNALMYSWARYAVCPQRCYLASSLCIQVTFWFNSQLLLGVYSLATLWIVLFFFSWWFQQYSMASSNGRVRRVFVDIVALNLYGAGRYHFFSFQRILDF